MKPFSTFILLAVLGNLLTGCEQASNLYYLSRSDVEHAQESYLLAGGDIVAERGTDLPGPFAEGPGVAGMTGGAISLDAGGKFVNCRADPGYRIEAWSYLMEDGRAWIVARQFRSN